MTRRTFEETIKADRNIVAAGLLQDLALLQGSPQSAFGYKRAAKALAAGIDRSVVDLIAEGTLRDVPFVGASSERLVAELVRTGTASSIVSTRGYLGDLQMHSTWSDGGESIETMAQAAHELGWTRIGMTDHSYG